MEDLNPRLKTIEDRLSKIEEQLKIQGAQRPNPTPLPQASSTQVYIPKSDQGVNPGKSFQSQTPSAAGLTEAKETSGHWLAIVGTVCLVIAAALMIKLSIDSGWLTPERQVTLASLFGCALVGAGFFLSKSNRSYASYLPAAGIVVLQLSVIGGYRLYSLYSAEVALILSVIISGFCVWIYSQFREEIYAITAAVGAYVCPLILKFGHFDEFFLSYYIICSISFSFISIWMERRLFALVASYLAILTTALGGLKLAEDQLILGALFVHAMIFSAGTFLHTKKIGQTLSAQEAWGFFPVLLIFYVSIYHYANRIDPRMAPWLSLAFGVFVLALYFAAQRGLLNSKNQLSKNEIEKSQENLASGPMILAFLTLIGFHSIYLNLVPDIWTGWFFVVILFFAAHFSSAKSDLREKYGIQFLAFAVIISIEYIKMIYHVISKEDWHWLAVAGVSVLSLWYFVLKVRKSHSAFYKNQGFVVLLLTHILAIAVLYRLTESFGSLAVSAAWLFYAIVVMGLAFKLKDIFILKTALVVLSFAAVKALLYDASGSSSVVRIACLLMTGAVLYGAGLIVQKTSSWAK